MVPKSKTVSCDKIIKLKSRSYSSMNVKIRVNRTHLADCFLALLPWRPWLVAWAGA